MFTVLLTLFLGQAATAQPAPDIRNFLRVTPEFCTGGQPRPEHFSMLKADGVKAVLNLRQPGEHRAEEEQEAVKAAGLKYFNIPVNYQQPSDAAVDEFLKITDDSRQPADVHSLHGGDPRRRVLDDSSRPAGRMSYEAALEEARKLAFARHHISNSSPGATSRRTSAEPERRCAGDQ